MELNKKLVNFESMNENTKLTLAEALLYTKGLAGGYGGDFPLSTASKDSIYRVPATNKFYVCETAYNGNQISAPNSNFVELSVWKNHDRLNKLLNFELIFSNNFIEIYENSLMYKFIIPEKIEVLAGKIQMLAENLKLNLSRLYQIPISNADNVDIGGWGKSDLVVVIGDFNIFVINQGENAQINRYTLNSNIVLIKDY